MLVSSLMDSPLSRRAMVSRKSPADSPFWYTRATAVGPDSPWPCWRIVTRPKTPVAARPASKRTVTGSNPVAGTGPSPDHFYHRWRENSACADHPPHEIQADGFASGWRMVPPRVRQTLERGRQAMASSGYRLSRTTRRDAMERPTLAQAQERFLRYQRSRNHSAKQIAHYTQTFRDFARFLEETERETTVAVLVTGTFEAFIEYLRATPLPRPYRGTTVRSIVGIHGHLKDLRAFVHWCLVVQRENTCAGITTGLRGVRDRALGRSEAATDHVAGGSPRRSPAPKISLSCTNMRSLAVLLVVQRENS